MGKAIYGKPNSTESVRIPTLLMAKVRKVASEQGFVLTRRIGAYIEAGMKALGDSK